jgi:hypothetical protein
MAMPTTTAVPVAGTEARTRTSLLLEAIKLLCWNAARLVGPALAAGIGCSGPYCHGGGQPWRTSLIIVQPQTVLRWRRDGWSTFWRYRSHGHWRGGRPRLSGEVRGLIRRMARENFLWGAPRIHGELLMLGFKVSQATVSRYLATVDRRRGQSWRTFLRNQAMAFSWGDDLEQQSNAESVDLRNCMLEGTLSRSNTRPASAACGPRFHTSRIISLRVKIAAARPPRRGLLASRSAAYHSRASPMHH